MRFHWIALWVLIFSCLAEGQIRQQVELTAADGAAGDRFGYSVSISGNTAAVAAPGAHAAYLFTKSGADWIQVAKLTAANGGGLSTVAVAGNTVAVGAPAAPGSVYVYVEPPGGWMDMTETAQLSGDGRDIGQSVAISSDGKTIVTGGPTGLQHALVFLEPDGGWERTTIQNIILEPLFPGGFFGQSVAIEGKTVAVGAPGANATYVFQLKPGLKLNPIATLTPSDGGANDNFGASVSISGSTIMAGSPTHNKPGATYVFFKPPSGWIDMTQSAELSVNTNQRIGVGGAVAVSANAVVTGAPGAFIGSDQPGVFLGYVEPVGGWMDTNTPNLSRTSSDGATGDGFGSSIAISGNTVIVGAPDHTVNGNSQQGAAYIFAPQ